MQLYSGKLLEAFYGLTDSHHHNNPVSQLFLPTLLQVKRETETKTHIACKWQIWVFNQAVKF